MVNYRPSYEEVRPGAIGASPSFVEGVHDQSTHDSDAAKTHDAEPAPKSSSSAMDTDVRMPEAAINDPSSPGSRQGDDNAISATAKAAQISSYDSPPIRPTARCKERITAKEAYNRGMLLQFLTDCVSDWQHFCCSQNCAVDDYETKWVGHQPLTPNTWSFHEGDESPRIVQSLSASGRRMERRRRKRGVLTPNRGAKAGIGSPFVS